MLGRIAARSTGVPVVYSPTASRSSATSRRRRGSALLERAAGRVPRAAVRVRGRAGAGPAHRLVPRARAHVVHNGCAVPDPAVAPDPRLVDLRGDDGVVIGAVAVLREQKVSRDLIRRGAARAGRGAAGAPRDHRDRPARARLRGERAAAGSTATRGSPCCRTRVRPRATSARSTSTCCPRCGRRSRSASSRPSRAAFRRSPPTSAARARRWRGDRRPGPAARSRRVGTRADAAPPGSRRPPGDGGRVTRAARGPFRARADARCDRGADGCVLSQVHGCRRRPGSAR